MERFFVNLKMERVWQRRYANHDEARRDINQYIADNPWSRTIRTTSSLKLASNCRRLLVILLAFLVDSGLSSYRPVRGN
jgi:hypothetical protein